MKITSLGRPVKQSSGETANKESWLKRNRPYRWGRRAACAVETAIFTTSRQPENPRKWAVGVAAGALATAGAVYGAVANFETAVTEYSFGAFVEGLGYVAIAEYAAGATKEMLAIYREKHEEAQWHELVPEEKRAA